MFGLLVVRRGAVRVRVRVRVGAWDESYSDGSD